MVDIAFRTVNICTGYLYTLGWNERDQEECPMTTFSYSAARERLAEIWDQVEDSREEVILYRRGHEDLALIPAHELRSLKETAHLLRSPRNAARLLKALARSREEGGLEFGDIDALAAELDPGE
jgi:antitoxin YefM